MTKQRTKISREFKLEAVRLLELGEKPVAQLALELGIPRNRLYKWRADLTRKGDAAFRGAGRKAASQDGEVARLRRELVRVTEERDILKKAAAYFARELP
ncbi:MAG: transposase [Rhodospirillaceae bacterium]|nr:transposase [Rhodospirillaceae bacterium]